MNNAWNKVIYKIWSPVYDKFFNSGAFLNARTQIFQETHFNSKQKILFVGVGTGADLELQPSTFHPICLRMQEQNSKIQL